MRHSQNSEADLLALLDRSSVGAPRVLESYRRVSPDLIRRVRETADLLDEMGIPFDDEHPEHSTPADETDTAISFQPWFDPDGAGEVYLRTASGMSGADVIDIISYRALHRPPMRSLPNVVHGRDELITIVTEALIQGGTPFVALVGPIGCGKSTVAMSSIRQIDPAGEKTWWISADTEPKLVEGLYEVAAAAGATVERLNDLRKLPHEKRCMSAWELLGTLGAGVVLVEDVTQEVASALAGARGHVALLATSRDEDRRHWPAAANVQDVAPLGPAEGARVLLDQLAERVPTPSADEEHYALQLADRFGGVPLALRNLGAVLGELSTEARRSDALSLVVEYNSPHDVLEPVYELSLAVIDRAGEPRARGLLRLLSSFGGTAVPEGVIVGRVSGSAAVLDELARTGLVERVAGLDGIPCVQVPAAMARVAQCDRRFDGAVAGIDDRAIALVLAEVHHLDAGSPLSWPRTHLLHRLVLALMDRLKGAGEVRQVTLGRIVNDVSVALGRAGDQQGAEHLIERALADIDLPTDHRTVLELRRTQAWLIGLRGDLVNAERNLRQLLVVQTAVLGYDHRMTLGTRDCLAWTLAEQGELRRAAYRFGRLVQRYSEKLGPAHPETLALRHRMAWVIALLGKRKCAAEELERVLQCREAIMGPHHLDVFSTRYRLAWLQTLRGKVERGEQLFRILHRDVDEVLGSNHPITLMVRSRVGWALHWSAQLDKAAQIYRDLAVDQHRLLGAEHPRTLRTRHGLACLLVHQGRLGEAITELRSVLADRKRILGPDHRSTLDSRSYLAWALSDAGQLTEAGSLLDGVLRDRERVLGPRHPETYRTRLLLAQLHIRAGRLRQAEEILVGLTIDAERDLESDARLVFDIRHARALLLGLYGKLAACEGALHQVAEDRMQALGSRHRETISTDLDLVWVIGLQGRLTEAKERCSALTELCLDVHGPTHPSTYLARYRQGWLDALAGNLPDAIVTFTSLTADVRAVLGEKHPETLRGRLACAWVLRLSGSLARAAVAYEELHRDCTQRHGIHTIMALRARDGLGLTLLEMDRVAEAERLFTTLRDVTTDALGSEHRDTLAVREHQARSWARLGRLDEAYAEFSKLDALRASYDPNHPDRRRAVRHEFLDRARQRRGLGRADDTTGGRWTRR